MCPPSVEPTVQGDQVTVNTSLVGNVKAQSASLSMAGAVSLNTENDLHANMSGAQVMLAGNNLNLTNGGAQVLLAGNDLTITNGGGQFIVAPRASLTRSIAVFLITGRAELNDGARILFGAQEAVFFGIVFGIVFGLMRLLFSGGGAPRQGDEDED